MDRVRLNTADRLSLDLFKRNLEEQIEGARFPSEYLQITQLDGVHQDIASTIEIMPASTAKHFEDILARLRGGAPPHWAIFESSLRDECKILAALRGGRTRSLGYFRIIPPG